MGGISGSEVAESGDKVSTITLKSGKQVQITMKDGSFRRITGLREHIDSSGSYIIRRVEIKKESGKSLGFYIREGDGWHQMTGIFVSRINLGSVVDVNRLLNVGDEIIKINNVDVTTMGLDDVVLIMQFVQNIVLTVKVLRGVADTLHSLKLRKRRRELPKTPSFLETKSKVDKQFATPKITQAAGSLPLVHQVRSSESEPNIMEVKIHSYEDVDFNDGKKRPVEIHKAESQSDKMKAYIHSYEDADIKIKEKKSTISLKPKPVLSDSIEVDIHPYEDVEVGNEKKTPGFENHQKIELPAMATDSLSKSLPNKVIHPYREIKIPVLPSHMQNPKKKARDKEDDDISPYAQVSAELKQKLTHSVKDTNKPSNASSTPEDMVDLISPYSEVKQAKPEEKPCTSTTTKMNQSVVVDIISPYSEVKKTKMKSNSESSSRSPIISGSGAMPLFPVTCSEQNPYSKVSNIKLRKSKGTPPVAHVAIRAGSPQPELSRLDSDDSVQLRQNGGGESTRLSLLFEDKVPKANNMELGGLLDIIKTAQFGPRSPVVRRSFILDDDDVVDPILDPSHIYAEVERKKDKNADKNVDDYSVVGVCIEVEPPTLPKTPVPFDPEEGEAPLFIPLTEQSQDGNSASMDSTSDDEVSLRGKESREAKEAADMDEALSEALAELDQKDTQPPPLPPPYVPDEGPPESSDSEEDRSEEHESNITSVHGGIAFKEEPFHHQMPLQQKESSQVKIDPTSVVNYSTDALPFPSDNFDTPPERPLTSSNNEVKQYNEMVMIVERNDEKDEGKAFSGGDKDILEDLNGTQCESEDLREPKDTANISTDSLSDLPPAPPLPQTVPPEPLLLEDSPIEPLPGLAYSPLNQKTTINNNPSSSSNSPSSTPKLTNSSSPPPSPPQLPAELPPPPPLPSVAPPEEDDVKSTASDSSEEDTSCSHLPTLVIQDIGTSSPTDKRFSGSLLVKIAGLDISSKKSTNFWSTNSIHKMIFILSVDNCVKINTSIPLGLNMKGITEEDREYDIIMIQNFHVKFSLHSICLPTVSKCAKLVNIFPSQQQKTTRKVLISFDHYGVLQLTLTYLPMVSMVKRLDPQGSSLQARFSDHVFLNKASGYPLILEQSLLAIEKFGLMKAHLYDRCASKLQKQRAMASCMEDLNVQELKKVVTTCSVHAFTGILLDFFCDLPEPFFTNKLSSKLIHAASFSREPEVLDQFLKKLPKDESKTLKRLLLHFRTVCHHGSKNGVSAKLLSRLFGPLLLIPSLSPDTASNDKGTHLMDFAEDYFSQSRVIELLMAKDETNS